MQALGAASRQILETGGWVMYPLLALSLLSLTLTIERSIFWLRTHTPSRRRWWGKQIAQIRQGSTRQLQETARDDRTVYGAFLRAALGEPSESSAGDTRAATPNLIGAAHLAAEMVRPSIERFGTMMAAIIAAAPLLGILGTVLGIITSFRLLGAEGPVTDPTAIAAGIAEALYTTAFGLTVALLTLFPHSLFRAQSDRCLGRLEAIGTALAQNERPANIRSEPSDEPGTQS